MGVDMAAKAMRNFKAGEVLKGLSYNPDLRASLIPAVLVADNNPLPFFMLEGNSLERDVPEGAVITGDMVVTPQDSALWSLRKQQDAKFSFTKKL